MARRVKVFVEGDGLDWDPKGLIKLGLNESLTWSHTGESLRVEFPEGHPFEAGSVPFKLERGGTKVTTVRDDKSLKEKVFPCFVKMDNRERRFSKDDGVIIE